MKAIWMFHAGHLVATLNGVPCAAWPAVPLMGVCLADLLNRDQHFSDTLLEPFLHGARAITSGVRSAT